MNFSNRVALVTGSSSGIGAAIARELASGGAKVAVHYRDNAAGAHAVQEKIESGGGTCRIYQADVSDAGQAAALVKQVQGDLGSLDILVNNAGTTRDTLLMTMKEEDWDVVIHTNLRSVFTVTKAALRSMVKQRWGRIINITSVVGLSGQAGQSNYAASKAGMIGFTKSLAREMARYNIQCNVISPGPTDTTIWDPLDPDLRGDLPSRVEMLQPSDVADAILYLASDRASFVTGSALVVDGGMTAV